MANIAPFCHACAWSGRGAVGRALHKKQVFGTLPSGAHYAVTVDLCEICDMSFVGSRRFEMETSIQAAEQVARSLNGG